MAKTAVVILNYNGRDFLLRFLPPLIQHTPAHAEIIVADNCSTDDSLEVLKEFPQVKVLPITENLGYAGGYNAALRQVRAEYYLLLNSDIEVTPNWLNPLEDFLDSNPSYAAVQPKILDFHRKDFFEYAGGSGGFVDRLGYPYCRGRIFDTLERDQGQYNDVIDVQWCSGACFLIRSSAFHEAGGFDADFFAHMEEIDLCWRLRSVGWVLATVPDATVYHVGGGTLAKANSRKTYLNFRNNIYLLIKNLPLKSLIFTLPIRFGLDLLAGFKLWNDLSFSHTRAVFKAWADAISRFSIIYVKRKNTSIPLTMVGVKTSILIAYYFKGKKRFSQLNSTK